MNEPLKLYKFFIRFYPKERAKKLLGFNIEIDTNNMVWAVDEKHAKDLILKNIKPDQEFVHQGIVYTGTGAEAEVEETNDELISKRNDQSH